MGLPYSAIGQLDIQDLGGRFICTGTLIGPDVVLTAAHCVFSRAHNQFFGSLDFAPGRYRNATTAKTDVAKGPNVVVQGSNVDPFGIIPWDYVSIYGNYMAPGTSDPHAWDLAVIHLSQAIGNVTGWMGVKAPCQQGPSTFNLMTAGYPLEKPFGSCMDTHCKVTQVSLLY